MKKENNTYLGFARVDITPAYNVQTVGFNREDNLSRGVLHKLFAQISIWCSDEGKACMVAIDHIGFMYEDSNTLRDMIGKRLDITREKVMLCFSHTHSSPNISLEPEYFRFLCEQVLSGVDEAVRNTIPVKAAWGTTEADIGVNRRNNDGVLDRRINILKVADAVTGKLCLLVLRLTAHANVLYEDNYLISSDFIGVARELLEKKYGCSVMITQGASGNIKPRYEFTLEALDKMASAVGNAVASCIDLITPAEIERLSMFSQMDTFYADVPSMDKAQAISEEAMRINQIDGTNWLKEVARLNAEGIKQQGTQTEIQYFVLDDGCLCGVASEIMCELAVDVSKACNDELIYFGGYTNGCGGYLPTAEEYDKGGYEVLHSYLIYYIYHGRVMPLNRDTAEQLVKSVAGRWKNIVKR